MTYLATAEQAKPLVSRPAAFFVVPRQRCVPADQAANAITP
jgi:hypothetical protein